MFKDYYQKELRLLRETAADFAISNPGLAGMLKESSTDPDTERLLEGFAFLTANIHRELDEQFPTFLYSLAQIVCPDYLRPMPSVTVMEFKPKSQSEPDVARARRNLRGFPTGADRKHAARRSAGRNLSFPYLPAAGRDAADARRRPLPGKRRHR